MALMPINPAPIAAAVAVPLRLAKPLIRAATLQSTHKHARLPMLSGLASWYGRVLQGHRTASGERFDAAALTACHRTLPFGTLVKVINLVNHRSVTVRITDRGALNANRVIDLSSAAAEELDMLRAGVAPVKLEILDLLTGKPAAAQPSSAPTEAAATSPSGPFD